MMPGDEAVASSPGILINHHPDSINESGSHLNPLLPNSPGPQKQTIASSTALLTATMQLFYSIRRPHLPTDVNTSKDSKTFYDMGRRII
ncbi:hypothetical protein TNIN_134231 [Trichonephila inaurata madagascariensis]|uniref:Uncharacterized protein n=1 Tax=Trichonephila inaurata madagascariensis TaxID=2747483 RepID=A0A8X6WV05_9ARAC|nr:hypothetical protein TNIN_134231 [Trichonephila inaurata madagascariensis]